MQDIDIKKLLEEDLENLPPDTRKKYKRYLVQLDRKQKHKKITEDFLNMLKTKSKITLNSLSKDQVTTINSLSGVQEFPMRIKCATMAWHTLLAAIEKKNN